jgi:hypothetical protein
VAIPKDYAAARVFANEHTGDASRRRIAIMHGRNADFWPATQAEMRSNHPTRSTTLHASRPHARIALDISEIDLETAISCLPPNDDRR